MRQEQYNFSDSLKEMYRHRQKKMIHKKDPKFDWNKYVLWLVPGEVADILCESSFGFTD